MLHLVQHASRSLSWYQYFKIKKISYIIIYLVTVKAGQAYSTGYENFVSKNLKDEVLQEITSNLDDSLKEEALESFLDSVKDGHAIKDCIFKVQTDVLPKVPRERNKFFIKFTYDNQLQVMQ